MTTLEAKVDTPGTGLLARQTVVEGVAAEANGRSKAIKGLIQDVNGYISGFSSTNDGTTSAFEILASIFAIRDPSSGEKIEYYDGNFHVFSPATNTRARYGKPFNSTQKMVWWTGPTSVAIGSETKANAYVYMSMNTSGGPRFGGSDAPGRAFKVQSSHGSIAGSRSGAGTVTTPLVTFTAEGTTGPVAFDVYFMSGDGTISPTNASSSDSTSPFQHQTAFTTTISIGQIKSGAFICSARDASGNSDTVVVRVGLHETT